MDLLAIHLRAERLIQSLQYGYMPGVVYDTAWVARLSHQSPRGSQPLFPETVNWLLEHQREDGSWGGEIGHVYDRVLSTLAAVISLSAYPSKSEYWPRIDAGCRYLELATSKLSQERIDTAGFEFIAPSLFREAQELGLKVGSLPASILKASEEKLKIIGGLSNVYSTSSPLAFSLEFMGNQLNCARAIHLLDPDGSIVGSPSATAYFLQNCSYRRSEEYLRKVILLNSNGSCPTVYPFEIFETAWVLLNSFVSGLLVKQYFERLVLLADAWKDRNVAWSRDSRFQDSDHLAVLFTLLHANGNATSADVFRPYETDTHFKTYFGERTSSVSTNAHLLFAISKSHRFADRERWITKLVSFLSGSQLQDGYWIDKWHISAYYATAQAIFGLVPFNHQLIQKAIQWILTSQHSNGLWGYNNGTLEETAYALQGLLYPYLIDNDTFSIPIDVIRRPCELLIDGLESGYSHPELWTAKVLFSPVKIIESAIISALYMFQLASRQ